MELRAPLKLEKLKHCMTDLISDKFANDFHLQSSFTEPNIITLVHQWNTKQVSSMKLVCNMYLVKTLSHFSEVLIFLSYYIWTRDSTFKWALSSSVIPEHNSHYVILNDIRFQINSANQKEQAKTVWEVRA